MIRISVIDDEIREALGIRDMIQHALTAQNESASIAVYDNAQTFLDAFSSGDNDIIFGGFIGGKRQNAPKLKQRVHDLSYTGIRCVSNHGNMGQLSNGYVVLVFRQITDGRNENQILAEYFFCQDVFMFSRKERILSMR